MQWRERVPIYIDDPAAQFTNINVDYISVSGPKVSQEIFQRLNSCIKNHVNCPKPDESCLPTRTIDVHPEGGDDRVRIHITRTEDRFKYLALSYSWGGAQEVTTTKATLIDRQHGIRLYNLLPTIQDAIQVTRDLGFRYLWIDALCIIQDDDEDKTIEINRMGSIYKNATITIAAANTTSVQNSFLAQRPIPQCCTLPYFLPDGTFGTLWIKDEFPDWLLSPLDNRAWALQESLLSPRILWYGPADLKWKCQTDHFEDIWNTHSYSFKYPPSRHRRLPASIFGFQETTMHKADLDIRRSEMWSHIIGDYSGRDITLAEDRVPALAGVAAELQKIWADDFLAGLWRKYLIRHLGWFSQADSSICRGSDTIIYSGSDTSLLNLHIPRDGQYHSPGWTWTSFKGRIAVWEVMREHAKVLDCQVTLADDTAPLLSVTGGRLVLMAVCINDDERLETDREDSWIRWDYTDSEQRGHINNVNKIFVYALLGETGPEDAAGVKSVALVLTPVGDGTFMRIGLYFNFNVKTWQLESRARRKITIV
ncbi:HET domain containing protein [Hyaloscypha variabilis]